MAVETRGQKRAAVFLWDRMGWLLSTRRRLLLLSMVTVLAVAVYMFVNHAAGFPLDDAWIHQDFARTLAQHGVFAYAPGRGGAGSTSPLWVLLLLPAQLVPGGAPLWLVMGWADALGTLAFFGTAWSTSALAELWLADVDERLRALGALVAGIAALAEWHLTWAALSGMETILFVFLSVLLLLGVSRAWHPAWLGALAALLTTTRPEGIVLALLVAVYLALQSSAHLKPTSQHWRAVLVYLGVYALGLIPLLVLNEVASGSLLPSTFYAKGVYYALGTGELTRLVGYALGVLGFVGSSPLVALGLPGAAYALWLARRDVRCGTQWLALGWVVALIGVYAIHLPVVYQNGRYLMPILPVLLALGGAGSLRFVSRTDFRLLPGVLLVLALALGVLSIVRGAGIYAANVRYINGYQVETALWLRANTAPDALVATHDIGAIGYFSGRQVIDLGGLTQPEIVPLLNDQQALIAYLQRAHVDYVVMFPDWFPPPRLLWAAVKHHEVHRTHDPAIAAIGGADLVTYKTDWGKTGVSGWQMVLSGRFDAGRPSRIVYTLCTWAADRQKVSGYDIKRAFVV
ncbi:MAG TPA: hypothetical protein VKT82_31275 [Ktedonobacterales bacterium]|nr:hypothetical protein [Ktedonobacterales bacterium]